MSDQTPNTKFASSMNHLKHGSTAKTLFLSTENPEDFFSLLENAFEQYQPAFDHDAVLVTRCIQDHWILLRRERAAGAFELALHERLPDPTTWAASDLHELHLFDRYKTEAARSYTRSLRNLQLIQKMARDDQRWQHQLAMQKQKLASDLERHEQAKAKEAQQAANSQMQQQIAKLFPQNLPPPPDRAAEQTVDIVFEDGAIAHFAAVPSNKEIRKQLMFAANRVVRTYNLLGNITAEFQHLVTGETIQDGDFTRVYQALSADQWFKLFNQEADLES